MIQFRHRDPLAAARAVEIDQVLDELAALAGPPPSKVDVMFESIMLAYAALASRHRGEKRTVLLGQASYDRAKSAGLIAWCAHRYPNLTIEGPSPVVRGCHPRFVTVDEAVKP